MYKRSLISQYIDISLLQYYSESGDNTSDMVLVKVPGILARILSIFSPPFWRASEEMAPSCEDCILCLPVLAT